MGKTLIRVDCIDQRLYIAAAPAVASGGKNEDAVEFSFCPLWEGFAKTGVFYRSEDDVYHAIVSGDRCIIPHEVLKEEGMLYFGVFGVKGDITRTSEIVKYRVVKGALTEGTQPSDPTPDIYTQILNQYGAMDTRVVNLEKFTAGSEPYEITGNPVQLENFEGMPMNVVAHLEPIQSGSGEPYPAGSGKNLLQNTRATTTTNGIKFTANSDGSITVDGTATENAVFIINNSDSTLKLTNGQYMLSGCPAGGNASSGYYMNFYGYDSAGKNNAFDAGSGAVIEFNNSGGYYNIAIGIRSGTKVSELTFYPQLEAGSTKTEWQPYANIRPITGRTGAELVRCGKNLLKYPYHTTATESNGITFDYLGDGRVHIKGTATVNVAFILQNYNAGHRAELKAGTYTVSGNPANNFNIDFFVYEDQTTTTQKIVKRVGGGTAHTFTVDKTMYYGAYVWIDSGKSVDAIIAPMLELGSAASAFEPYQGDTFTLNFGQTVYGGKVDVHKGEMVTLDNRARAFDGTEGWGQASSAANTFYLDYYNSGGSAGSPVLLDAICSHYKTSKTTTLASSDRAYYPLSYSGAIYRHAFTDSRFSTVAQWKAYLAEQAAAGTPVQAIEKLPTPTTIQLTPQQITALAGLNTVYSDADGITVSGRKDILWLMSYLLEQNAELRERITALETAVTTE